MKNNNYIKHVFCSLLVVALLISCDDFVDVTPEQPNSDNFFNNQSEYESALIGAYDLLQSTYLNVMLGEIASDNTLAGGESANDVPGIQQVDDMIHNPVNQQLRDIWGWMYSGVNRANFILEFKDKTDFNGKEVILAEARFLRAYYYFELVKWFGDVPLVVDKRIQFGDQFTLDRTPKADVYAQIEVDLISAAADLPDVQAIPGKAKEVNKSLFHNYIPNIIIVGSNIESKQPLLVNKYVDGQTFIYVCTNGTCKLPQINIKKAINLIKK